MKILIIHGPNMNLFGLRSAKSNQNITLDKINKHIRKYVRNLRNQQKEESVFSSNWWKDLSEFRLCNFLMLWVVVYQGGGRGDIIWATIVTAIIYFFLISLVNFTL